MLHWLVQRTVPVLLVAAVALAAAAPGAAQAAPPISVVVDGKPLVFSDAGPFIENDRTLVPLRGIFEALGAKVAWDDATRTVTATRAGVQIRLQIGNRVAAVGTQSVTLDVAGKIVNDRTFVPLRFVSEALGAVVGWDAATRTITITNRRPEQHAAARALADLVAAAGIRLYEDAAFHGLALPDGHFFLWAKTPGAGGVDFAIGVDGRYFGLSAKGNTVVQYTPAAELSPDARQQHPEGIYVLPLQLGGTLREVLAPADLPAAFHGLNRVLVAASAGYASGQTTGVVLPGGHFVTWTPAGAASGFRVTVALDAAAVTVSQKTEGAARFEFVPAAELSPESRAKYPAGIYTISADLGG